MSYSTSLKFKAYFCGFFLLSLLLIGGVGAVFIRTDDGPVKTLGIIGGSLVLASLLGWRMARDAVLWDRKHAAGKRAG